MSEKTPAVALGSVLHRSVRVADLDPKKTYKQIKVRMHNRGLKLRGYVTGKDVLCSRQFLVNDGQFLVARIGAANGAVGLVPHELDGAIVSSDFWVFECDKERLMPEFLELWGRTVIFRAACEGASSGTTRVRLQEEEFLRTAIPLPPIREQRRIVARIEQLAAKIEEARHLRRQTTEEAAAAMSAVMREVFRPGQGFEEVLLETTCAEIIDNLHSNPIYADDGLPCVRSPDVGWGKLHLETALKTSEEEYIRRTVRGVPKANDIVLVREGGGTGKAAIVEEGQKFSLGQRVMMLRPNQTTIHPKFLLYQLLSPAVHEDQILPLSKGSASPHLNIGALRKFKFLLPPVAEQRRIVAYLDGLQAKVDTLKKLQAETAAELDALLPSILDRAFRGEL